MIIYDRQINRLFYIAKSEDCRYQVIKTTEVFFLIKSRCFFFLILFSKSIFSCIVEVFVIFLLVSFFYFLKFFKVFLLLWKTFYFYPGTARYCKCPGRFIIFFVTQFSACYYALNVASEGPRNLQKPSVYEKQCRDILDCCTRWIDSILGELQIFSLASKRY